jgi:hypothetical protein
MEISKGAVGILAAVCLTAGGAGAYLASRGSEPAATETASQAQAISPDPAVAATGENGVEQSEGVIADVPATSAADTRAAAPAAKAPAPVTPRRSAAPETSRSRASQTSPVAPARPQEPVEQPAPREEARIATPPAIEPARTIEPEPARAPEPPQPQFEELVVSADSVMGLEVETSITSERARVEDAVVARVTRDVKVGDRVAIPAGAKAHGEVTLVDRGGRLKDRARLGIRFTSVVLADGTKIPLETETIYREGSAPSNESAAKIGGGAIGGAIIGGILGGAKGAIIGGSAGAGAGTAAVMAGGRNAATLPSGTPVTVRVAKPATVTVEK